MEHSGWRRFPRHESDLITPHCREDLVLLQRGLTGFVARGYVRRAVDLRTQVRSRMSERFGL